MGRSSKSEDSIVSRIESCEEGGGGITSEGEGERYIVRGGGGEAARKAISCSGNRRAGGSMESRDGRGVDA